MQDYFRVDEGVDPARLQATLNKSCQKRVTDMFYESRVQCVVNWYRLRLGERMKKEEARTKKLTREQYIEVDNEYYI